MGTLQDVISLDSTEVKKKYILPDSFAIVPAVTLKKEKIEVSAINPEYFNVYNNSWLTQTIN